MIGRRATEQAMATVIDIAAAAGGTSLGCCASRSELRKHHVDQERARLLDFGLVKWTDESVSQPDRASFGALDNGLSCSEITRGMRSSSDERDGESRLEASLELLRRAQAGDGRALEVLLTRYRPRLHRWAHRRLPNWARGLADTDDLIQDTLVKAIRNLHDFVAIGESGFQNYLRSAVANAIRDEIRKARNRPSFDALDPSIPTDAPSPLERAVGRLRLERYEIALLRLSPEERDAVVARLEFGFTHVELAAALGKRTPDAARKLCQKAVARLLTEMDTMKPAKP